MEVQTSIIENYSVPEAIALITKDLETGEIDYRLGDLAFLASLQRYVCWEISREVSLIFGDVLKKTKREYDEEGPEYKPPMALLPFFSTDGDTKTIGRVLVNLTKFATVYGCGKGCKFCAQAAPILKESERQVIPLEQKKNFIDMMIDVGSAFEGLPVGHMLGDIALYDTNNFFEDPDAIKVLRYIKERKVKIKPNITVAITKDNVEQIKEMSKVSDPKKVAAYRQIDALIELIIRAKKNDPGLLRALQHENIEREEREMIKAFENLICNLPQNLNDVEMAQAKNLNQYLTYFGVYGDANRDEFASTTTLYDKSGKVIKKELDDVMQIIKILGEDLDDLENLKLEHEENNKELTEYLGLESIFDLGCLEDQGVMKLLQEKYYELIREMDCLVALTISKTKGNEQYVKELEEDDSYFIQKILPKDSNGEDNTVLAGLEFYKSGKEVGEKIAISSTNGLILGPHVLFNRVSGEITHDFPSGEMRVPFMNFSDQPDLSQPGTRLDKILPNVMVLKDDFDSDPWGEGVGEAPSRIYVCDGLDRIRRIDFNTRTFIIEKDEIVMENAPWYMETIAVESAIFIN